MFHVKQSGIGVHDLNDKGQKTKKEGKAVKILRYGLQGLGMLDIMENPYGSGERENRPESRILRKSRCSSG